MMLISYVRPTASVVVLEESPCPRGLICKSLSLSSNLRSLTTTPLIADPAADAARHNKRLNHANHNVVVNLCVASSKRGPVTELWTTSSNCIIMSAPARQCHNSINVICEDNYLLLAVVQLENQTKMGILAEICNLIAISSYCRDMLSVVCLSVCYDASTL